MANYVLEILDGDRAGDVLSLSDRPVRIGRKPGNDLVLADEKTSGVHAEVVVEGDRYVLRDLGSTNGTFLDGKRVTEIVLSPGDVVTVGRLRVKYREATDAAAPTADAGELSVHRLDAGRLQKRGGSMLLVGLLFVVAAGGGGFLWWRSQGDADAPAAGHQRIEAMQLAGNKLSQAVAACEAEEGWNLRAQGSGFQPMTRAHTGSGGFEAVRGDEKDAPGFAIATLAEPVPVLAGRVLTLQAFTRTDGDGQVAVRAVFSAANDNNPFRFRTGGSLQQHGEWKVDDAVLAVPPGCDRLQIEILAVLPGPGSAVHVDDVGVIEAGTGAPIESKLAESKQTAIGTATALGVRSTDPDNPATLLAILPEAPEKSRAALDGLQKAGLCCLSDLGVRLECKPTERSFQIAATGTDALQFVFPADAAGGLLVRGAADGTFGSASAESTFQAQAVLVGDRLTRAMLTFPQPVACTGRLGGGRFRLAVAAAQVELVLGFQAERQQADGLLREARARVAANEPGPALDKLRALANTVPQDTEMLQQAQLLRSQLLAAQGDAVKKLQHDLDEAEFFSTRGGFLRVALGVDDLVTLYGEQNLGDLELVKGLGAKAHERLAAMDAAAHDEQRQRLVALAKALEGAQQTGLAGVVQDYVKRNLGGQ